MDKNTRDTLFSSDKNYWETPQEFFDRLNEKYHFTLDAAASHNNHKVDKYFTAEDDGLKQNWGVKSCSVILRMEVKKLENGLKSVMKKHKSLILQLFCLFLRGRTDIHFTSTYITSPV